MVVSLNAATWVVEKKEKKVNIKEDNPIWELYLLSTNFVSPRHLNKSC